MSSGIIRQNDKSKIVTCCINSTLMQEIEDDCKIIQIQYLTNEYVAVEYIGNLRRY